MLLTQELAAEQFEGEWRAVEGSDYFQSPLLYKENGFKKKEDAEAFIQKMKALEQTEAEVCSIERKKETRYAPLLFNLAEPVSYTHLILGIGSPHMGNEPVISEHLSAVLSQQRDNLELILGQVNLSTVPGLSLIHIWHNWCISEKSTKLYHLTYTFSDHRD